MTEQKSTEPATHLVVVHEKYPAMFRLFDPLLMERCCQILQTPSPTQLTFVKHMRRILAQNKQDSRKCIRKKNRVSFL